MSISLEPNSNLDTAHSLAKLIIYNGICTLHGAAWKGDNDPFGTDFNMFTVPSQYVPSSGVSLAGTIVNGSNIAIAWTVALTSAGYIRQKATSSCKGVMFYGQWVL